MNYNVYNVSVIKNKIKVNKAIPAVAGLHLIK